MKDSLVKQNCIGYKDMKTEIHTVVLDDNGAFYGAMESYTSIQKKFDALNQYIADMMLEVELKIVCVKSHNQFGESKCCIVAEGSEADIAIISMIKPILT